MKLFRNMIIVVLPVLSLAGCNKKEVAPPPPTTEVAAPAAPAPVQPGMEAENPAEKEGNS